MPNSTNNETKSNLILQAFLLDTQIEHPEQVLLLREKEIVLLSEIISKTPSLLHKLHEERASVYRQLGWDVPDNNARAN